MGKLYQKIMAKWGGKVEETKSPVQANVDANGTALHTIRVDDDVYSVDKTVESAIEQSGAILADEYTTLDTSEMTEQDLARLYQTIINKRAIILAGDTVLFPMYDDSDGIYYSYCVGTSTGTTIYTYKIEYDGSHESVTTISYYSFAGFGNPMNSAGDIIVGGTNGAPTRLGVGTNGQVPMSNGTTIVWSTILPVVTPSDEGKFARVNSSGQWVAETVPNANSQSF